MTSNSVFAGSLASHVRALPCLPLPDVVMCIIPPGWVPPARSSRLPIPCAADPPRAARAPAAAAAAVQLRDHGAVHRRLLHGPQQVCDVVHRHGRRRQEGSCALPASVHLRGRVAHHHHRHLRRRPGAQAGGDVTRCTASNSRSWYCFRPLASLPRQRLCVAEVAPSSTAASAASGSSSLAATAAADALVARSQPPSSLASSHPLAQQHTPGAGVSAHARSFSLPTTIASRATARAHNRSNRMRCPRAHTWSRTS